MGEVYRAVDRKMFDRTVAIKFLSERLTDSEEGRLRFRREVETSARLHHPNIVTIYDWGEHQGRDFFVMEFVDGSDLQVLLKTGVSWDLEQRLEVAFQTADALDFAHRAGVIHRDMKPGNVMVVSSESGPHVKLVDFGIAHVERSNLTQEQSHPGTFTYMAPEQLRGDVVDPLDPRRDVFSLGIVLCELFSGHHPFEAKSEALITNRVLHGDPDPPSRHVAGLPPELDTLILRMLAKDPEQRPGTAREVADALRALSRKAVAQSVGGDAPEDRPRAAFISPRMKEVDSALDAGKVSEALALLSQILRKYPDQTDAAVMLERLVSVAADGIA
jgi:serine/threonine protein kinase